MRSNAVARSGAERLLAGIAVWCLLAAGVDAAPFPAQDPSWRSLPSVDPAGVLAHTGSYVVTDREEQDWTPPPFRPDPAVCIGHKRAKVLVVIFDPILECEGGVRLIQQVGGNDPWQYSHILVDVVRQASWGYVDYEIVDFLHLDAYPMKVDGFRYTDESFLEVRKTQQWQPATTSYRSVFEENHLLERFREEGITELWMWGASGMHFDEFAFHVPGRYARWGPTDNPWLYRPYDIPPELERTTWVMGFNYEVGADNMIHSYSHRVESIAALVFGQGIWNPAERRDPWNVFTWLEMDHPGTASVVGNCHVPPNGTAGYDYSNRRKVLSTADHWHRYPDVRGPPREINADDWGGTQFGYQKWLLERIPKNPGWTDLGYDNWWVYIANTDEDLSDSPPALGTTFQFAEPDTSPPSTPEERSRDAARKPE